MVCIVYYLYYKLLYEIGLGDVWETDAKCVNHSLLIQQFEQWLKDAFIQSCVSNMETSNRCLLYRTLCREFSMASYLYKIHIPANRKAMTKFRLSSHKLMVERGRWLRVPRTDRLCVCCNKLGLNSLNSMLFVNVLVIIVLGSYTLSHIM